MNGLKTKVHVKTGVLIVQKGHLQTQEIKQSLPKNVLRRFDKMVKDDEDHMAIQLGKHRVIGIKAAFGHESVSNVENYYIVYAMNEMYKYEDVDLDHLSTALSILNMHIDYAIAEEYVEALEQGVQDDESSY